MMMTKIILRIRKKIEKKVMPLGYLGFLGSALTIPPKPRRFLSKS
jgi:hypothetical protein